METIMLIDENNLMYRMLEINKGLMFAGKRTGGLYGYLLLFCKYVNLHKPDYVVVCADKPPYKRRELFGMYKKDRSNPGPDYVKLEYIRQSRELVRRLSNLMNLYTWEEQGYESDDLMAVLVNNYKDKCNILICSNDDDLYQLLETNVSLQRSKDLYTKADFIKEFPDLKPEDWSMITAMCGNHNGVKNIYKGLGVKTAIKILKDENKLEEFLEKYTKELAYNMILTHVPFDDGIVSIPRLVSSEFSLRKLETFLMQECGIRITKQMDEAFSILGGK